MKGHFSESSKISRKNDLSVFWLSLGVCYMLSESTDILLKGKEIIFETQKCVKSDKNIKRKMGIFI